MGDPGSGEEKVKVNVEGGVEFPVKLVIIFACPARKKGLVCHAAPANE